MTPTSTSEPSSIAKKRTYKRLMLGFIAGGVGLALLLREVLGYPLVSEAVYWVGIVGFLAVWWGSSQSLFDERDRALERRASYLTLSILGPLFVVAASTARLVPQFTDYTVPSEIWSMLWGFFVVYLIFGISYLVVRYRA